MKIATVIDVGLEQAALKQALRTQSMMLEQLGARLDSIRLAVPRLLPQACAGAVKEAPDVLVIAGGPRSARVAGQLAHRHRIPILFLPGFYLQHWAQRLWGGLSLESMIAALARGAVERVILGAGSASGQLFFGSASCGLLPNLAELRRAWMSETLPEAREAAVRAASLSRLLLAPGIRFRAGDLAVRRATALALRIQHEPPTQAWRERRPAPFACEAWKHSWVGHIGAAMSASVGTDWHRSGHAERFECKDVTIESERPVWLVLDEDPVRLNGPVEVRYIRDAVQTFAFNVRDVANDNVVRRRRRFTDFNVPPDSEWNFPPSCHVADSDGRVSGGKGKKRQV